MHVVLQMCCVMPTVPLATQKYAILGYPVWMKHRYSG